MVAPARRSKLGVASFIISIGTFSAVVITLLLALAMQGHHGVSSIFGVIAFYTFFFVAPAAHLTGLVLGIVALFQKRYGKFFAVFGIILNILFPGMGALLIYLALSALGGFR